MGISWTVGGHSLGHVTKWIPKTLKPRMNSFPDCEVLEKTNQTLKKSLKMRQGNIRLFKAWFEKYGMPWSRLIFDLFLLLLFPSSLELCKSNSGNSSTVFWIWVGRFGHINYDHYFSWYASVPSTRWICVLVTQQQKIFFSFSSI